MNEEVQFYLDEAKERMEAALSHLEQLQFNLGKKV